MWGGREVAVKKVTVETKAVYAECRLLASLDHRNIIGLLGACYDPERDFCMVMGMCMSVSS